MFVIVTKSWVVAAAGMVLISIFLATFIVAEPPIREYGLKDGSDWASKTPMSPAVDPCEKGAAPKAEG